MKAEALFIKRLGMNLRCVPMLFWLPVVKKKTLYIEKIEPSLLYPVVIKTYLKKTCPKKMSEIHGSVPHPLNYLSDRMLITINSK